MTNILVVEDEVDIRDLVMLRLELAGHTVSFAENGKIGREKALADLPDLVLLDMHMPVMSGHEAIKKLRERDYTGLVVGLTASAMVTETNKAICSGCDAVITKPITDNFEDLVAGYIEEQ